MATNDKAMCRLLFAMLKQKCLKDIDWNKVAADPVLLQPITNGHAARMRYSRFRSSVDPEAKLHKSTDGSSRVSKPKKEKGAASGRSKTEPKPDNHAHAAHELDESATSSSSYSTSPFASVKLESPSFDPLPAPATSALSSGTMFPESQVQFHNRLMTPSSDFMGSPGSEFLNADAFDFSPPVSANQYSSESQNWHHSPTYPSFALPHAIDTQSSDFSDHPPTHQDHHTHHRRERSSASCLSPSAVDSHSQSGRIEGSWRESDYHTI